ncbi:hypothetical protein [Thalassospira lucentensis]|uniref:hypothetical protein n=1 Tax=Thalassospira lucentensis TaxID=168935 RepID=UPI003AA80345
MSLIGVYSSRDFSDENSYFEVEALHFNLWIIPQRKRDVIFNCHNGKPLWSFIFPRFSRNYIDVGLRIKVIPGGGLNWVDLHLPATNSNGDLNFFDLSEVVLDDRMNDLLFGRKVDVDKEKRTISYYRDGKSVQDEVVKVQKITDLKSNGRFRVEFAEPLKAQYSESYFYIRFRYECQNSDEILNKKGWGFAKAGFVIDVRLNDIRETVDFAEMNQSYNMKDVKEFNAFVVHPTNYMRSAQSPNVHYSRLLEPNAWRPYLVTCEPYSDKQKYVINQWKTTGVVSSAEPYRMFAQLQNEFGLNVFIVYIGGILSLPFLSWLASLIY